MGAIGLAERNQRTGYRSKALFIYQNRRGTQYSIVDPAYYRVHVDASRTIVDENYGPPLLFELNADRGNS